MQILASTTGPQQDLPAAMHTVLLSAGRRGRWLTIRQTALLAESSLRSFQRRLANHGLVFSELVQVAKSELAREMLHDDTMSISDVARRTGYSKASNFSRAFQRWTGQSPAQFRDGF